MANWMRYLTILRVEARSGPQSFKICFKSLLMGLNLLSQKFLRR